MLILAHPKKMIPLIISRTKQFNHYHQKRKSLDVFSYQPKSNTDNIPNNPAEKEKKEKEEH
jgi:hypothetical protein